MIIGRALDSHFRGNGRTKVPCHSGEGQNLGWWGVINGGVVDSSFRWKDGRGYRVVLTKVRIHDGRAESQEEPGGFLPEFTPHVIRGRNDEAATNGGRKHRSVGRATRQVHATGAV